MPNTICYKKDALCFIAIAKLSSKLYGSPPVLGIALLYQNSSILKFQRILLWQEVWIADKGTIWTRMLV